MREYTGTYVYTPIPSRTQMAARLRTVRTLHRHPYEQNPTHTFHTLRPRRTDTYRRRFHPTYYSLRLTLLQRRCPLQLKAEHPRPQDSVIPTAPTSDSTTPSERVMTKTDHSRHKDSIIPVTPLHHFSSTPSSATQENPDRDIKSEDRGPRPKTRFRNQIVKAVRKLF